MNAPLDADATGVRHASDACTVRELPRGAEARWDAFVHGSVDATFFHRAGWRRVIEKAFGHRTHFLVAEAGGVVVGVLPLAEIRSIAFGRSLISLPFCVYGGPLAAHDGALAALDRAAQELARARGVDFLEYRSTRAVHADWPQRDLYVTFRRPLSEDEEVNMDAIPRKQRAMVRKGIKEGLTASIDKDVDRFFPAYSESVHRLGTPVFSRRYFALLLEEFGTDADVLTITRGDELIASVLSFYFRDQVLPYYGGGTAAARAVAGNDFMYWELMRHAVARGCRLFDFGRSKRGTGAFDFKKNWGFEPEPLQYEVQLHRASEIPEHNPLNPKYRMFIQAWQRLPLPVANLIGPHIVKNLG